MLTSRQQVRTLGRDDLSAFLELAERDPVVNVFADYRARTTNLEPRWLGGEVWGRFTDGELTAACHVGANLVPVECTLEDVGAFAERALQGGRTATTIVGLEQPVEAFWQAVSHRWRRPREIRRGQPHLQTDRPAAVEPDPLVRATVVEDFEAVYPACVAMYTEEVGVSPEAGGGGDLYRARVRQLINRGWSFARFDEGRLVFKAEVACTSPFAAQVQGVWVPADRRGEGLATAGMAAVVEAVRRDIAPVVSLYVNDWNEPARRAYERVGFVETARFTTVMF
ncbi:MAG: GNAT family N-acetyltransferase [Nocardioidaceae bacterium]